MVITETVSFAARAGTRLSQSKAAKPTNLFIAFEGSASIYHGFRTDAKFGGSRLPKNPTYSQGFIRLTPSGVYRPKIAPSRAIARTMSNRERLATRFGWVERTDR